MITYVSQVVTINFYGHELTHDLGVLEAAARFDADDEYEMCEGAHRVLKDDMPLLLRLAPYSPLGCIAMGFQIGVHEEGADEPYTVYKRGLGCGAPPKSIILPRLMEDALAAWEKEWY